MVFSKLEALLLSNILIGTAVLESLYICRAQHKLSEEVPT